MKILIINGPNLGILGKREPEIYGSTSWEEFFEPMQQRWLERDCTIHYFQSNSEGEIIDRLLAAPTDGFDAIVINPGAYSHYSLAITDALSAISTPAIEIHISNIFAREEARKRSLTASACKGMIAGLGLYGYEAAVEAFYADFHRKG